MRDLVISVGVKRTDLNWKPRKVSWEQLVQRLSDFKRTGETVQEFRDMAPGERKSDIKDVGGFVGGYVKGRRLAGNVVNRSLLTFDIDFAKKDSVERIRLVLDGTAWCIYSTHSHRPDYVRLRLVLPLSRDVTPDEYDAVARKLAEMLDIEIFDDTTYEPHRLMYWPSCPRDAETVFLTEEGEPVDADALLGSYVDWRDFAQRPRSSRAREHRAPTGKRLEDPATKGGIVGAFCRAYSISQAIETFLSDVYEPTVQEGRYTYKEGTTAGGLVVYDDKFAYSHHATDPISGREVNAFDLVRIHKFQEPEEAERLGDFARASDLPSYKRMAEFAGSIPEVKAESISHGLRQSAEEDFGAELPGGEMDIETLVKHLVKLGLRKGKGDVILSDPFNFKLICDNDPALKDTVRYDSFADRAEVTRDLPWRPRGTERAWDDNDDKGLIWYISMRFKMTGKQAILDAHDLVIRQSAYHPVRDYLNALSWDGTERLDTMLVDYLGAVDSPLVRAMTRKHMVAAVARIMHPGAKYDYALTLSGPEGIGKTTLIKRLGMNWYSNSFSSGDVGNKESMEQVRGQWLIELGELVAVKKNTNEAFKNFITTDVDKYRPAYARKASEFPRQCVFWATTNERYYLKGDTGNRRFWTVYVGDDIAVKDVFSMSQADVDQLWAEAVVRWKAGEPLYLPHDLDRQARELAEDANEISGDERIGVIEAFIRRPIPTDWQSKTRQERADWFRVNRSDDMVVQGEENRRKYICAQEVANELYQKEMTRYETREINQILNRIRGLRQAGSTRIGDKAYGGQRRYEILPEFWAQHTDEN